MRKVSKIIVLSILIISLSGCLSTFYSPRIVEPNTTIMGGGISGDYMYCEESVDYFIPMIGLFIRKGYNYGIDVGLGSNTSYFPLGIDGSVRKQFNIPLYIIDGIILELGGNIGLTHSGILYNIGLLKNNIGINFTIHNVNGELLNYGPDMNVNEFGILEKAFIISYTIQKNKFEMPISLKVSSSQYLNVHTPVYIPIQNYNDDFINFDRIGIAIGLSVYVKI